MSNAASLLGLARFQALANSIEVKKGPAFDEDFIIYIDGEMVTIGDLVRLWQEVRKQTKKIDEALTKNKVESKAENKAENKVESKAENKVEKSPRKKRQSLEQPKNGEILENSSKKSKKLTRSPSSH